MDDKAGKKARCAGCGNLLVIPAGTGASTPAQSAAPAPVAARPFDAPRSIPPTATSVYAAQASGGAVCPSCSRPQEQGTRICIQCGIHVDSGKPILTSHEGDLDRVRELTESVVRGLSWVIPIGLYPVRSEATRKYRPYATWAIAAVTIVATVVFWGYELGESEQMGVLKNAMLWPNDGDPNALIIVAGYEHMSEYGNAEAFEMAFELEPNSLSDEEQVENAYASLTDEQKFFGSYRHSQLITHALLHGGIMHLAGNLLFLLIFCGRVNGAVGNIATLLLYPLLAVAAGAIQVMTQAGDVPVPMVGASGAIMGMAGMYLVLFPIHKVHMAAWFRWGLIARLKLSFGMFALPGIVTVLFYIAFDVAFIAMGLESDTAHWAHLGGFLSGAAVAVVLLATRLVHTGADVLSVTLGKYAWPLIGSPAARG